VSDICLSIVVAMSENRVIGKDNGLPWKLPRDLAHFKKLTMGYPVVMGRATFDSIGRVLPGRTFIVVTRNRNWVQNGVLCAANLEQAVSIAKKEASDRGLKEIMIIGGDSIYQQLLPQVSKIYLTEVNSVIEGDAFFPELSPNQWQEVTRQSFVKDEHNMYDCSFVILERSS